MKRPVLALTLTLLMTMTGGALGESSWRQIPDSEISTLPRFCWVRMKMIHSPEYNSLLQTMGPDLLHTHHYCEALVNLNRFYSARDAQARKRALAVARGGLAYMIEHASPGYGLMPEVYARLGEVLSYEGKTAQAIQALRKAIDLDPQRVRAYNTLSDLYDRTRQRNLALQTVTEGLRHLPGTSSLQRRYREYGGKLPYPEPLVAAPAEPEPQAVPDAGTPAAAVPTGAEPAETTVNAEDAAPKPAPAVVPPPIGTPTNPYCRFCP